MNDLPMLLLRLILLLFAYVQIPLLALAFMGGVIALFVYMMRADLGNIRRAYHPDRTQR